MAATKQKPKSQARKAKGTSKRRCSKFEMDKRIEYAEGLLASGVRHNTAVQHLKEKFKVDKRQAERYIAAVYKQWRGDKGEDRRLKMTRARARRQEIYLRALKKEDLSAANKALETLEKMEGIAPDQTVKVEHSGEVTKKVEIGENLEGAVRELMKDKKKRKALAQKVAPTREDEADDHPGSKGRRSEADGK